MKQYTKSIPVWLYIITIATMLFPLYGCTAGSGNYLEDHYVKKEYRIPMRDGTTLFTAVYSPRDRSVDYPILLQRTPYSVRPYGEHAYPGNTNSWIHLIKEGFIFVFQDVRGRFMSEGEYVNMRPYIRNKKGPKDVDESSDTYDTIDWLVKNVPNNNGKVGMWGISYPGFYAAMGAIDAHPALKAVSPQAPISNWFVGDDFHHNGAFTLVMAFRFYSTFGIPRPELTTSWPPAFDFGTPDGYLFYLNLGSLANADKKYFHNRIAFWDDMMKHGTYDEFWKARNTVPDFHDIKPAVMTVGGWFDAEDLYGALHTYESIEKNSPDTYNILVMGPWFHGGWVRSRGDSLGNISFSSKTSLFYRQNIELPFFKHFLKGAAMPELPEAWAFETGSNRWETFDQWPPKVPETENIYFHTGQKLDFAKPVEKDNTSFDEYPSDPAKPVPYTTEITTRMPREYMVEDQRFASRRPDVLVYQSDVLESDISIAGPIKASLYVSTSGTDADWIVKVIDVLPNDAPDNPAPCSAVMGGYQMLLRGEIMRGKFRDSYEHPRPFEPEKVTPVNFTLNDVFHTFRKGHRIMVQIQSSWFPLFDRNPQTFVDIYNARQSDFQKATQRIYHSADYPSHLELPVIREKLSQASGTSW